MPVATDKGDYPKSELARIDVEWIEFAVRKHLTDWELHLAPRVEVVYKPAIRAICVELRAAVLASKSVNDYWSGTIVFVRRPVRDGILLWLSRHARPRRIRPHFAARVQWVERSIQHQRVEYYGCPHLPENDGRRQSNCPHYQWFEDGPEGAGASK